MSNLLADAFLGTVLAGFVYYLGTLYGTGRRSD